MEEIWSHIVRRQVFRFWQDFKPSHTFWLPPSILPIRSFDKIMKLFSLFLPYHIKTSFSLMDSFHQLFRDFWQDFTPIKFSFFEKATKICLILLSKRQNHEEGWAYFVAFLEKLNFNNSTCKIFRHLSSLFIAYRQSRFDSWLLHSCL